MKVWILTYEVNEYDQYGEYFADVWLNKPSAENIEKILSDHGWANDIAKIEKYVPHVLNGGGRKELEHMWFWLREVECQ